MTWPLHDGRESCYVGLKGALFRGIQLSEQFLCKNKVLLLRFWVLREINSRFCSKTQWQMFLLVSGRHVGAPVGGHQHGVSIQISVNLGKNVSPHISHKKNCFDLNLGEILCISTFFLFPDSRLNLLNGFEFLFWSILNGVTLKTSNSESLTSSYPYHLIYSRF